MRYILLVSGMMLAGKTSLSEVFLKNEKRLFRTSFDTIKKLISDFDGETDRMLVMDLLFALSKEVAEQDLSFIVEGSASILLEMRAFYKKLAEEHSIVFFEVNLEAPLETLEERFQNRVSKGKAFTVSTSEQFMRRYNLYLEKRDPSAPTYNSGEQSPEEIYNVIKKDILSKTT